MNKDVFAFENVKINHSLVDDIFAYDVSKLEQTSSLDISKFSLALSQYSIYIKSQTNKTKASIVAKERSLDGAVFQLMTSDLLKQYKTKKDAALIIISGSATLNSMQEDIDSMQDELLLIEGIDKTISDYISTFKRELTRRENEQWQTRKES
jgi:hypothetical protein